MKTSILSVNLIARMLMLLCSVSSVSIAFAQSVSIEFLPNGNANSDFEILQYELLPDNLSMSDVDRSHTIRHRMFTKTLSGEWIGGKEESMLGEEELFVRDLISTFNNLTDVTELESLLDEESYTRKLDEYASYQNQVRFDKVKYADWTDTRPFAVVRYGNVYVIICDIRKEGLEGESEYETEIIKAIHHQGKYQLTESLDQADSYDGIINGYLNSGMAEGRILDALRNRAGISPSRSAINAINMTESIYKKKINATNAFATPGIDELSTIYRTATQNRQAVENRGALRPTSV